MVPVKLLISGAGQAVACAAIAGLCDPMPENLQAGAQLYPQARISVQYDRRDQETVELPVPQISAAESGHGWAGSVADFLDLLEGRIDNPIPARAGAQTVALCTAGLEAMQSGQPQRPVAF